MKIKKYLSSFFTKSKSPQANQEYYHKRKAAIFWHRFMKILTIKLIALLAVIFFFVFFTVSFAQAPIHALIDSITKPKPISQSSIVLPESAEKAIVNLASFQIKQDQEKALLATITSTSNSSSNNKIFSQTATTQSDSLLQNIVDSIQIATTIDPSGKAKIRIRHINRLINSLQNLLAKDRSDAAINQAVKIIQKIGAETKLIIIEPKTQTDPQIITLQIEQYNRLQLNLQKIEDQFPIAAYLQIEDARQKNLVVTAIASLNVAPNLNLVHNIAIKTVSSVTGSDYEELKAIEILADLQNALTSKAQQKLNDLQKELAIQFEKRMLKLPSDVRTRKLQNYINFSYGDPIDQVRTFTQMQHFLTDREMILSIATLKELALKRVEDRLFELKTPQLEKQFSEIVLRNPADIKILVEVQLDVDNGQDKNKIKFIDELVNSSVQNALSIFEKNKQALLAVFSNNKAPDLLDTVLVDRLQNIVTSSSQANPVSKQAIRDVKEKTFHQFIANVSQNDFTTQQKLVYNPVSQNSDVRMLFPSPYGLILLKEIQNSLPAYLFSPLQQQTARLTADRLLTQINDPQIFNQYYTFIANNPQVKQLLIQNNAANFLTLLDQKEKIIAMQAKAQDQRLYEKTQQIVQDIFIGKDPASVVSTLPTNAQNQIIQVQQNLPANSVPKIETPSDVKLSIIAPPPNDVQNALIAVAKQEVTKSTSFQTVLDLATEAKALGTSVPSILPDNPFYPILNTIRELPLLLPSDPVTKAEELIHIDNQKTLEAAALIQNSQSTTTVNTVINTLDSIKQDFENLLANAPQVKQIEQTEPQRVYQLVNQVIDDGVIRETLISQIENKMQGDAFVAVEQTRQAILQDGVNTLLDVTNNNVKKLTDILENTVTKSNDPSETVAEDIKAVDLLTEIARTLPESAQKTLQAGETTIAASLEKTLESEPLQEQIKQVTSYVQETTGNPVRQAETAEVLKDDFTNPQTILLTNTIIDTATQNLKNHISEIPDVNSQNQFVDTVIGDKPQDLKIVTEIASLVAPPQNAGIVEVSQIVQQINDVKANIVQNIVDTYKDNPQALEQTALFANNPTPDVIDVKVAQDITNALSNSPDVQPAVVEAAKQEETKLLDTLVANISKPEFTASVNTQASIETSVSTPTATNLQTNVTTQDSTTGKTNISALAAQTLNSSPDTLATLIDLKTSENQAKIDVAIAAEVHVIADNLGQTTDPAIVQVTVAQITQNPVVSQAVTQAGGQAVEKTIERASQNTQQQETSDQTQLQTTVTQVQHEILSAPLNAPSPIEQTLPQPVQQEIQQVKQEVPAQQIPIVSVEAQSQTTTATTAQPVDTSSTVTTSQSPTTPTSTSAPSTSSSPASSPPAESAPSPVQSSSSDNSAPASTVPSL